METRAYVLSKEAERLLLEYPVGTIHSVYKNTINLNCGQELLISLTTKKAGVHPFSVCFNTNTLELPPNFSLYAVRDGVISIGNLRFRYEGANRADLQMRGQPSTPRVGEMAAALDSLLNETIVSRSALGFLYIPTLSSPLERWREDFIEFANGIARADPDTSTAYGKKLLGMGWGLTPSADDFCVGLLAAKQFVHGTFPAEKGGPFLPLADVARTRTNKISYNFLYHACRGRFGQTLLSWLEALAEANKQRAFLLTERLTKYGHSSGTDIMVGAAFGLRQIAGVF